MRAVLMYHSIDDSGSPVSVTPEAFSRQLEFIEKTGTATSRFGDFELESKQDGLCLTFDDAFANFETEAWPRLKDRGMRATVFVVSGHVGTTNRWNDERPGVIPEFPLMDWDALGKIADEGCDIGCHTQTHPHLTSLDDDAVTEEIVGSLDEIERRIGRRPRTLAYPYGDHDDRIVAVATSLVERACTTEFALIEDENPHEIPRLDAWYFAREGFLESWGTTSFALRVKRRNWLRRLRRMLPGIGG